MSMSDDVESNNKMAAENVLRYLHKSTERVELLRADLKNKDSHLKELMRKMNDAAAEKSNISLSVDELKQKLEKKDEGKRKKCQGAEKGRDLEKCETHEDSDGEEVIEVEISD